MTELVLLNFIVVPLVSLVAWMVPTIFVNRCRGRDDANEDSLLQRTKQYSNDHPVRMISLESVPILLFIIVAYPLSDIMVRIQLPIFLGFNLVRIIAAWRRNKYEV